MAADAEIFELAYRGATARVIAKAGADKGSLDPKTLQQRGNNRGVVRDILCDPSDLCTSIVRWKFIYDEGQRGDQIPKASNLDLVVPAGRGMTFDFSHPIVGRLPSILS